MVIAWRSVRTWPMKDARQVTLKLLLRRPLALPRFEDLCRRGMLWRDKKDKLQRICDQARTEQSPSKSSLPYVSARLAQHLPVLTPRLFLFFAPVKFTPSHSFPFLLRETIPSEFVYHVYHSYHGLTSRESEGILSGLHHGLMICDFRGDHVFGADLSSYIGLRFFALSNPTTVFVRP